jgi:circadian clock protein KaiC
VAHRHQAIGDRQFDDVTGYWPPTPTKAAARMTQRPQLLKAATGIDGLDAITEGGLPAGRPTLLCGAAGCGKTLFGVTFLVEGALRFDEPGILMTFEERPEDISDNVESLGYNLPSLIALKKLVIDQVKID